MTHKLKDDYPTEIGQGYRVNGTLEYILPRVRGDIRRHEIKAYTFRDQSDPMKPPNIMIATGVPRFEETFDGFQVVFLTDINRGGRRVLVYDPPWCEWFWDLDSFTLKRVSRPSTIDELAIERNGFEAKVPQ